MYICLYVYMRVCVYVSMSVSVYVCMCGCMRAWMHMCIYIYLCTRICVYMYAGAFHRSSSALALGTRKRGPMDQMVWLGNTRRSSLFFPCALDPRSSFGAMETS